MGVIQLSLRKIFTGFALLIACVLATLTIPTPASASAAAAESHGTVTPAACSTPLHDGSLSEVAITLCGSTATAIGAKSFVSFFGHMEFFGPHGHIANTPDAQFFNGTFRTVGINQSAPSGSLWCVNLWEKSGSGYILLDRNCVQI